MASKNPAKDPLEATLLRLVRGSMDAIRLAEARLLQAVREDRDLAEAQELHLALRSGSLGLLVAYSQMTGLPDPRVIHEESA